MKSVERFGSIGARIELNSSAIGITANFKVAFKAHLKCLRCLNSFTKDFQTSLYLVYIQGKDPNKDAEKVDLKFSEVERVYLSGNSIDLSIGIREAIVLSIPITLLCHEGCRGLCPVCGINRNTKKCKCKVEDVGFFTPVLVKKKTGKRRSKRK